MTDGMTKFGSLACRKSNFACGGREWLLNPLTPMSDQDRISPYNINTKLTR